MLEAEVQQSNQQMKVLGDQKRTKICEIVGLKRELVSLLYFFNVNVCLHIIGATSSRTIKTKKKTILKIMIFIIIIIQCNILINK